MFLITIVDVKSKRLNIRVPTIMPVSLAQKTKEAVELSQDLKK